MLRNLLLTTIVAGSIGGVAMTVLQTQSVVPLILEAETYEDAAPAALPARRTTSVSPIRASSRAISSVLCKVALATVTPPTNTGRSRATGVNAGTAKRE